MFGKDHAKPRTRLLQQPLTAHQGADSGRDLVLGELDNLALDELRITRDLEQAVDHRRLVGEDSGRVEPGGVV